MIRALSFLTTVLAVAGLFSFTTSVAQAQFEVIDFEDLQVGDGVLANTPLYNIGDGPAPIPEMFVGEGNPDLDGKFLDGDSADGGSFVIGWDFSEPINGTATLSQDVDNWGANFYFGFTEVPRNPNPQLNTGYNGNFGFGASPFNGGAGAWSGTDGWDLSAPVHMELTTTWVGGDSTDRPVTFTVTQDATAKEFTHTDTMGFNVGQMRAFYDRRAGQNIDFDNISFIGTGPLAPGTDFTWDSSESGDWVADVNWLGPFGYPGKTIDNGFPPPSTPDRQSALFGAAIGSTSRTVFADTAVSLNRIHFDNSSANYAIAGNGSVNLLASTRPVDPHPAINVAADNSHQFQAIVSFHADGTVDIDSGSTLEFNNRLFLNSNELTKTGAGTLAISNNVVSGGGTINCAEGTCSGTGTIGGDLNNGGGTISPGNSAGILSVVPEPASVLLFFLGIAVLLCKRRRRQ